MKGRIGMAIALIALALSPIGAGASGHGPLAMLAFTGLFFLANAVIRPGAVTLSEPGAIALQLMTAGAFAAVLVGLGQTARAVGQIEAEIGLEGWLVLAAWGAVLGRLVYRASMGDKAMAKAERTLRVVHGAGRPATDTDRPSGPKAGKSQPRLGVVRDGPGGDTTARARRGKTAPSPQTTSPLPDDPALREALDRLNDLPEDGADDAALTAALATLSGAAPLGAVFAALSARAGVSERDRRALAWHSTDPWVLERQIGKAEPASAFEAIVAAADAVALGEFATRALAALDAEPAARHDMPSVARLLEIADQIEDSLETEAELLVTLAHTLEDLAIDAERAGDE